MNVTLRTACPMLLSFMIVIVNIIIVIITLFQLVLLL